MSSTTTPVDDVISELRAHFGDRVTTNATVLEAHGHGESRTTTFPPDVVCYPTSTEEVSAIVKTCAARGVPIVPFGAGTSVEAHVAAVRGGVCIDMSQMNNILEVRVPDLDVTVQAGVTRHQLNAALVSEGVFFPVDPGADATLGGMAATRASGTTTVRYGAMRDNVVNLTVVLADGQIIRTQGRARKSSSGYDLTHLFIGSEGTLGIITELTLRIYGVPEVTAAAVCTFPTVDDAVRSVIEIVQFGIPRVVIAENVNFGGNEEFLRSRGVEVEIVGDARCIALMRRYLGLFPATSIRCLLADREFIGQEWMDFLNKNNIPFAIRVKIDMTLTAPGCGMGPVIAEDARKKIAALPTVEDAKVHIVWDPQWTPQMISDVGRKTLGIE